MLSRARAGPKLAGPKPDPLGYGLTPYATIIIIWCVLVLNTRIIMTLHYVMAATKGLKLEGEGTMMQLWYH